MNGTAIRRARLYGLTKEHGLATECEVFDEPLGRWALMERDEGSADNGGPWWNTGDDWRALLHNSANAEYPADWPADRLFDLDSDWSSEVVMAYMPVRAVPEGGLTDD